MEKQDIQAERDWESGLLASMDGDDEPETDQTDSTDEPVETDDTPPADEPAPAAEAVETSAPDAEAAADKPHPAGEEPAPAAQPTAEIPKEIKHEPLRVRTDGREFDVPGAFKTDQGVVISTEAWERHIQPNLRDGRAVREAITTRDTRIRELEAKVANPTPSEAERRSAIVLDEIDKLFESPDKLRDFLDDFERNSESLGLRVENRLLKEAPAPAAAATATADDTADGEAIVSAYRTGLMGALKQILAEPGFRDAGLKADELEEQLWELREHWAQATDRNDPLKTGFIDANFIRKQLQPAVNAAKTAREAATAKSDAAKRNAAVLDTSAAPAAVTGKTSTSAVRAKEAPKTKEEWEDSVLAFDD